MRLVTWNIQWGRGADGRVDLPRVVAQARRLADFDVLCLQEVCSAYPELAGCDGDDQFVRLAELFPGYTAIAGVATDTPGPAAGSPQRRRAFGNMILARHPVHQVFRHLLPWPADAAVPSMQRIALEVTLEVGGRLLRVTTTHLEYYSAAQRMAQIERLRALHEEAVTQARCARPGAPADGPFAPVPRAAASILCGDFNLPPHDPGRARLLAPFGRGVPAYRDAWEICHPGRPHEATVGLYDRQQWPGEPLAFDYVFVSDDLAASLRDLRVDAVSDASDHQPVLLELA